jgi:hypothetical protein
MAAAVFEATSCPRVRNEIKKTKLHSNTEPAADINTLLCAVALHRSLFDFKIVRETRPVRHRPILISLSQV